MATSSPTTAAVPPTSCKVGGKPDTRETLLCAGGELIGELGFGPTGINAILKRAGVPKGSFYHYFQSKEDFGLALLDRAGEEFDQRLAHHLGRRELAPLDRLRGVFEEGIETMESCACARGCMAGKLAQELAGHNEAFRERLEGTFRGWEARIAACLAEARKSGDIASQGDTAELAPAILAAWEGALLRAKVAGTPAPLRSFIDLTLPRLVGAA